MMPCDRCGWMFEDCTCRRAVVAVRRHVPVPRAPQRRHRLTREMAREIAATVLERMSRPA